MTMRAVIPAGGFGTRMLPATKSMPKEMLPVLDKPAIQYVVEEAVASGIRDIAIVTGRTKRAIEDHFDAAPELEHFLEQKGNRDALAGLRATNGLGNLIYVRQDWPRGLGHAVLAAAPVVEGAPFAVLLGDDIIVNPEPVTAQLRAAFERLGGSVIAVQRVAPEEASKYGVVAGEHEGDGLWRVTDIVEKPAPGEAPSDLAVIGRYVFTPEIVAHLRATEAGAGGEVQLTDAIRSLAQEQAVYALEFQGRRFDVGSLMGWLEANVAMGLADARHAGMTAQLLRRELGPHEK